jgi:hypothetical protein
MTACHYKDRLLLYKEAEPPYSEGSASFYFFNNTSTFLQYY